MSMDEVEMDMIKKQKGVPGPGSIIRTSELGQPLPKDPWIHRSEGMLCRTCIFFVPKELSTPQSASPIGRCRRHAPTMSGYPVVFPTDWCGDHKVDENKFN